MFLLTLSIAVFNTAVQGQPLYDEMSDPCKNHRKSYEIYKEHVLSLQLEKKKSQEKCCNVKGYEYMWIGATYAHQEGVYVYKATRSRVYYGDWDGGQPDGGRYENCAVAYLYSNWRWHDYSCNKRFHYVCKKTK
ncbi:perlucin-like [Saccostrea cucullata]|uniref:perlucin-like n=1 Tax=Saccostrea cuccullata TaxID=36930 RepID=UPI002ED535E3